MSYPRTTKACGYLIKLDKEVSYVPFIVDAFFVFDSNCFLTFLIFFSPLLIEFLEYVFETGDIDNRFGFSVAILAEFTFCSNGGSL